MKSILLINKFLFSKGGDAISTFNTGRLFSEKRHKVYFWGMQHPLNPDYEYKEFFVSNVEYNKKVSFKEKVRISLNILYSFEAKKKIEKLINKVNPDIVHLNNFAHQISPSILPVIKKYKIPMVMTMRDYKLVCPSYSMLSKGLPCDKCKNGKYYWCFFNKCTKNSYLKSFINTVEMYLHHKILHIYDLIHLFIAPSRFMQRKVIEMGFNKKPILYLPNFVWVKEYTPLYNSKSNYIVYVGRLSFEKGLFTLLNAMKGFKRKEVILKIVGQGPLEDKLKNKVKDEKISNVEFLGFITGKKLFNIIRNSFFVVLPSEWYENNPRSIIESFAFGKPAIGSSIGGIPELIIDGVTGYLFKPKDHIDLSNKIKIMLSDHRKLIKMGKNARRFVEMNFNPDKHYEKLMEIYNMAITLSQGKNVEIETYNYEIKLP